MTNVISDYKKNNVDPNFKYIAIYFSIDLFTINMPNKKI